MQNLVKCCTSVIMERVKRHLSLCALEYSQFPHKMNLVAYGGWTLTLQLKRLYQLITFPSHSLQPKMIVLLTSYGSLTLDFKLNLSVWPERLFSLSMIPITLIT